MIGGEQIFASPLVPERNQIGNVCVGVPAMTRAQEYRQYAEECLRWAMAQQEKDSDRLLQMAHDWTLPPCGFCGNWLVKARWGFLRADGGSLPDDNAVKPGQV